MANQALDIAGQRFGSLLVIRRAEKPAGIKHTEAYWLCRCDCGKEITLPGSSVRNYKGGCTCDKARHRTSVEAREARKRKADERKAAIMAKTGCTKSELAAMSTLSAVTEICPTCGQSFERLSSQWVYKTIKQRRGGQRTQYYCSWKCFRQAG